jgi:cyclic pyranopterin phosphate synthase
MKEFDIVSVNISKDKGTVKTPVNEIILKPDHGVENDAHAGTWHRQVSFLALESIEKMQAQGLDVKPGDFAENITTKGVVLYELPVGTKISIGECELEVTQIGKECHTGCEVFKKVGACVMPKEGIFVKVVKGGVINAQSRGNYSI